MKWEEYKYLGLIELVPLVISMEKNQIIMFFVILVLGLSYIHREDISRIIRRRKKIFGVSNPFYQIPPLILLSDLLEMERLSAGDDWYEKEYDRLYEKHIGKNYKKLSKNS